MLRTRTDVQLLQAVEVDGRPIVFEHGMLLLHGGGADWHAVLMRVGWSDVLRLAVESGVDRTVLLCAGNDQWLAGNAQVVRFRSASDGIRLIGSSAIERAGD